MHVTIHHPPPPRTDTPAFPLMSQPWNTRIEEAVYAQRAQLAQCARRARRAGKLLSCMQTMFLITRLDFCVAIVSDRLAN